MTNGQGGNFGPGGVPGEDPDKWSEWVMPQDGPHSPYQDGSQQTQQFQQPQQYQQPQFQQPQQYQQPPQFEQQYQPQPSSEDDSKSSSLPYILLILLLTVLLAGGAIWYLTTQLSSNKDQPSAQQRTNYVSPSTSKQPSTSSSSSSSSSSTTTTKKKEHKPRPTGTKCGDMNIATIYSATSVTSCEFAMQVGRVVGMRPEPKDGDRFTVQAHSPVTDQNYSMKCVATGDPVTEIVCTGGNNARVQIVVSAEGR